MFTTETRRGTPLTQRLRKSFARVVCPLFDESLRAFVVTLLHRRLCTQNHRALRRQDAAIAVRYRGFGAGHLAGVAVAAQLPHRLYEEEEPVHAGMAIGEAAAIGIDRQPTAGGDMPAVDKASAVALRAKPEVLEKEDRVYREGVVELDDIDVAR